mmetsp:Transcript_81916/g.179984  ORF Transcript_81916/g.179984 Transcript_81916/m.179984 type:complete len:235 (+) Transcript_81916:334-1038(+)
MASQDVDGSMPKVLLLTSGLRFLELLELELVVRNLHSHDRIVPNGFDLRDHVFHWAQNQPVGVLGEEHRSPEQHDANKAHGEQGEEGLFLHIWTSVEVKDEAPSVELGRLDVQPGCIWLAFRAPQLIRAIHQVVDSAVQRLCKHGEPAAVVLTGLAPRVPVGAKPGLDSAGHGPQIVHVGRPLQGRGHLLLESSHGRGAELGQLDLLFQLCLVLRDDSHPENCRTVVLGAHVVC